MHENEIKFNRTSITAINIHKLKPCYHKCTEMTGFILHVRSAVFPSWHISYSKTKNLKDNYKVAQLSNSEWNQTLHFQANLAKDEIFKTKEIHD